MNWYEQTRIVLNSYLQQKIYTRNMFGKNGGNDVKKSGPNQNLDGKMNSFIAIDLLY